MKIVNESLNEFLKGSGLKSSLGIGFGKHSKTKDLAVLDFIKSKGEEGASFTEIQNFIWTELSGYSEEEFMEKDNQYYDYKGRRIKDEEGKGKGPRKSRGYWTTNLYGTPYKKGLLTSYCHKNEKGKWVLDRFPKPNENIF